MIEVISAERCTGCNICVEVCPTNVFEIVKGEIPVIARQQDCQTCYMCELYCPFDALFVHQNADEPVAVAVHEIERLGLFGKYRQSIGWSKLPQDKAGENLQTIIYTELH